MTDILLFDLDGTLTDPKEGITNCVKYALESVGITETNEQILMRFIGPPLVDSFMEFYGFNRQDALNLVAKYRERFAVTGIFENRLYDGVREMLRELKASGYIIALATSKPRVFAKRICEKYEIAEYFDIISGSELNGTNDYKNQVIEAILAELNSPDRKRVIMIGDRRQDIEGAKQCKIRSVGVRFGYAEEGELEKAGADYIVNDIEELKALLHKK